MPPQLDVGFETVALVIAIASLVVSGLAYRRAGRAERAERIMAFGERVAGCHKELNEAKGRIALARASGDSSAEAEGIVQKRRVRGAYWRLFQEIAVALRTDSQARRTARQLWGTPLLDELERTVHEDGEPDPRYSAEMADLERFVDECAGE